ncbi:MAG: hypothetical protein CMI09_05515 [Oceanospirillaceae bacterium]|nr:hypothetical protein [Oceanospirillaceae bacterium]
MTKQANEDVQAEETVSAQQDLETIKEILFGAQVRQAEDNRQHSEDRLIAAIDTLRQETLKSFEQVQQSIRDLNTRLDQQIAFQKREDQAIQQTISENLEEARNDAANLQEDMQEMKRELNNKDTEIQDEMDYKFQQLEQLLQREVDNLQDQKADRNSLATLLTGIATQLSAAETASSATEQD